MFSDTRFFGENKGLSTLCCTMKFGIFPLWIQWELRGSVGFQCKNVGERQSKTLESLALYKGQPIFNTMARIFSVRSFRRTEISPSGFFAVRRFCRTEFSPYGIFAVLPHLRGLWCFQASQKRFISNTISSIYCSTKKLNLIWIQERLCFHPAQCVLPVYGT